MAEAKFSPQVKNVISYSRTEALRLNNDFIGTEHILLGLIENGKGRATEILIHLGIDLKDLKSHLENYIKKNYKSQNIDQLQNIPLIRAAEKALKLSYLEGKIYEAKEIDTEHILLSILKDEESGATKVLNYYKIDYKSVKEELDNIFLVALDIEKNKIEFELSKLKEAQVELKKLTKLTNIKLDEIQELINPPISLYFDLSEFSKEEISEIITYLSDVYNSLSGDELEIVGTQRLEFSRCLEPVYA